jgi:hypothetical protein
MIIYLIVCSHVYGGYACLPSQRMPSQQVCAAVANQYRKTTDGDARTTCLTIRIKP